MKLFVITPNAHLSESQTDELKSAGELIVVKDMRPLEEVKELFEGDEPRVVAIDPDFSDWVFPNDVIDKIPNLKAICLQTTSFSWIDVEHCAQKGIPVMNLRGFSSIAVSEWAMMMTLAVARRVPLVIRDNWKLDYEKHRGFELRGKVAGVVGLGRIGTAIAENLAGLGMRVQYWSKHSEDSRFSKVALDELMRSSDVVIPATAYNAETEKLLTDDLVKSMNSSAVLVGITHPIYNQDLVLDMVATGRLGGYAFEDEKGPFGKYEGNVWNGPALGWCTNESMSENTRMWVESTIQAAKGQYPTKVN